jgi:hypothetical protein
MIWKPRERKIFRYWNGERNIGVDPIEADMALKSVDLDWKERMLSLQLGESDAMTDIVEACKKVFKLKEYDIDAEGNETGLTPVDIFDLLAEFIKWREEVANFFESSPTSVPATDYPQAETLTTAPTAV